MVLVFGHDKSFFDRFLMGLARFSSSSLWEGLALGTASGQKLFGLHEWLEYATALPRVGLLEGPDCRGKAEQDPARTRSSRCRCRQ